jgi:metal-sulfur cluster biosynthetic enzyme
MMMPTQDDVLQALSSVIDPEIGLAITDLGLIYDIQIEGGKIAVKMTLTTMGCPLASHLIQEAKQAVERVEGATETRVELVWDPPWNPGMMSDEARARLGMM